MFSSWAAIEGLSTFLIKSCEVTRGLEIVGQKEYLQAGDHLMFIWDDVTKTSGEIFEVINNKSIF